jgi:hypothetical protein
VLCGSSFGAIKAKLAPRSNVRSAAASRSWSLLQNGQQRGLLCSWDTIKMKFTKSILINVCTGSCLRESRAGPHQRRLQQNPRPERVCAGLLYPSQLLSERAAKFSALQQGTKMQCTGPRKTLRLVSLSSTPACCATSCGGAGQRQRKTQASWLYGGDTHAEQPKVQPSSVCVFFLSDHGSLIHGTAQRDKVPSRTLRVGLAVGSHNE